MKKTLIVIFILALSSCSKELPWSAEGIQTETLKARIVNTRVSIDDLGKFSWTDGDKIAVHRSVSGYETAALSADGCFSIHLSDGEARDGYAVYPADIVSDAASLTVNLPAAYSIAKTGMGNYSPLPMIAVNDPEEDDLYFRHLGGILRLVFPGIPYETQTIIITPDKKITGSFAVEGLETDSPFIECGAEPGEDIVFTLSSPAKEKEDFVINLPLPVGTYEALTYKIYDRFGNLVAEKTQDINITVERGDGFATGLDVSIDVSRLPLCAMLDRKGTVKVVNPLRLTIEYSLDNEIWTPFTEDISIPLNRGQRVYFRGNNKRYSTSGNTKTFFKSDVKGFLFGNIMSLITPEPDDFSVLKVLEEGYNFVGMFGSPNWFSHPDLDLLLPATTLKEGCYLSMFSWSCISRIDLPATELAEKCYSGMFAYQPISLRLTHCPVKTLPAIDLADDCYSDMFRGCAFEEPPVILAKSVGSSSCSYMFANNGSLKEAPELHATLIDMSGYSHMFEGCVSLTKVPYIANISFSQPHAFSSMFKWCKSLNYMKVMFSTVPNGVIGSEQENWLTSAPAANGTFVMNSAATYNPADIGIPSGWTIQPATE